jgi:hypothetical protein
MNPPKQQCASVWSEWSQNDGTESKTSVPLKLYEHPWMNISRASTHFDNDAPDTTQRPDEPIVEQGFRKETPQRKEQRLREGVFWKTN